MFVIFLLPFWIDVALSTNGLKLKFDTSTSYFENLLQTNHFVDKTDLVRVFYESAQLVMVTAPRQFGKSSNLDMLKRFFEITVDKDGNRMPTKATKNYALFKKNSLNIYIKDPMFFEKHFGSYPTIHLNFKGPFYDSYKSTINALQDRVSDSYHSHDYLLQSKILSKEDREELNKNYRHIVKHTMTEDEILKSVKTLSRLLYSHFNKTKVMIFIDEFDAPIQELIYTDSANNIQEIFNVITRFVYFTLETNLYMEKGLMCACMSLSGLFTTYSNQVQVIPSLNDIRYCKYYGLTEVEIKNLLTKLKMTKEMNEIKHLYDGYTTRGFKEIIYNTHSVVEHLETKALQSYWPMKRVQKHIERSFACADVLIHVERLLEDFESNKTGIKIMYCSRINTKDIQSLREILIDGLPTTNNYEFMILQCLAEQGYFNMLDQYDNKAFIRIPNREMRNEILTTITSGTFYRLKFGRKYDNLRIVAKNMAEMNNCTLTNEDVIISLKSLYKSKKVLPYNDDSFRRDMVFAFENSQVDTGLQMKISKSKDILLTGREKAIAIRLITYRESSYDCLSQLLDENYFQDENNSFKTKILAGIHFSLDEAFTMSYLINSRDISEEVTLSTSSRIYFSRKPHTRLTGFTRRKYTREPGFTRRTRKKRS